MPILVVALACGPGDPGALHAGDAGANVLDAAPDAHAADAHTDALTADAYMPVDAAPDGAADERWAAPLGGAAVVPAESVFATRDTTDLPIWFEGALWFRFAGTSYVLGPDGDARAAFDDGVPRQCGARSPDGRGLVCLATIDGQRVASRYEAGALTPLSRAPSEETAGLGNDHAGGPATVYSDRCGGAPSCSRVDVRGSVFTLAPGEGFVRHDLGLQNPNGLAVDGARTTLFVTDSAYRSRDRRGLYRVTLDPDGRPGADVTRVAPVATPDGLALDGHGHAYVATDARSAVVVDLATGETRGRIETRSRVTNLAFGGADGRVLYLTTFDRGVYALRLPFSGDAR